MPRQAKEKKPKEKKPKKVKPVYEMTYRQAVKKWNEGKDIYCNPKKGSPQYDEVLKIREGSLVQPVAPQPVAPQPVAPQPVAPQPEPPKPKRKKPQVAPQPEPPKPKRKKPQVAPQPVAPQPEPPKPKRRRPKVAPLPPQPLPPSLQPIPDGKEWEKDFKQFLNENIADGEYKIDYSAKGLIKTFAILHLMTKYNTECAVFFGYNTGKFIYDYFEAGPNQAWYDTKEINKTKFQIGKRVYDCRKRGAKLIVIPFAVRKHANMMIYRVDDNTLEHYEPHGAEFLTSMEELEKEKEYYKNQNDKKKLKSVMEDIAHKKQVEAYIKAFYNLIPFWEEAGFMPKGVRIIPRNEICPLPTGLQTIEGLEKQALKITKNDVGGGFCQMWSLFYLEMCLKFPTISGAELNQKAIDELKKMGMGSFIRHIINYTKSLNQIMIKTVSKGIDVMSNKTTFEQIRSLLNEDIANYIRGNVPDLIKSDEELKDLLWKKVRELRDVINQLEKERDEEKARVKPKITQKLRKLDESLLASRTMREDLEDTIKSINIEQMFFYKQKY